MSENNVKTVSRKKFLVWGATFLSAIGLIKILKPFEKKKPETRKFLTQDGQLVEVDTKHVLSNNSKIYTSDVKDWIKK